MGVSASSIAQKLIDTERLQLAQRGVSEMPKNTSHALTQLSDPKSARDSVIEMLNGREPAFLTMRRLADKRKRELDNLTAAVRRPLFDPTKPPPFIERRLLEQNAQEIVDYLAEKRSASLPNSEEQPIYPTLTEEDEDEDEEEWVRGWVFLDQGVYRSCQNNHPEWRGERLHLKALVHAVVDDTPFAASLIDREAKRGEITTAVEMLMSDPRLTKANKDSVERIFRTIRTGN